MEEKIDDSLDEVAKVIHDIIIERNIHLIRDVGRRAEERGYLGGGNQ